MFDFFLNELSPNSRNNIFFGFKSQKLNFCIILQGDNDNEVIRDIDDGKGSVCNFSEEHQSGVFKL